MAEESVEGDEFRSEHMMEPLSQVFEDFPLYTMLVDEDHSLIYMNRILRNDLGGKLKGVLSRYCSGTSDGAPHPRDCPLCESIRKGYVPVKFELRDFSRNLWLATAVCPLHTKNQNEKRLFLCIFWDPHEAKLNELLKDELKRNEEIYSAIFDNTPNMVGIFTGEGVIVDANAVMAECFGSDLAGRNVKDVLPGEVSEKWMGYIANVIEGGRRLAFEFSCSNRHYLMSMVPVDLAGERHCLLIGRDVTEMKHREMLLRTLIRIEKLVDSEKDRKKLVEEICSELSSFPNYLLVRIDLVGKDRLSVVSGNLADAAGDMHCRVMERAIRHGVSVSMKVDVCDENCTLRNLSGSDEIWITSLPLRAEGVSGALTVFHSGSLSQEELAILETLSADISFALRAFELEEIRVMAHKKIEDNIRHFAVLTDEIKNALTVISGIAELRITGEESTKILDQVDRIKKILKEIDREWIESEKLRKFLKKYV
ncbi:PAS domain-containing protein [Geoglobus acetivorans]|uniref:PAS domain-containing protein n=1 Tax=Geoglobus acetivorans TaxID=565033 RepID=A0ABZ3H5H5_GEOAI|nr:PAS domain-containing protein [Geoglobus acetivorans]